MNKNYILTAGHCCNGVDFSFQIVAGEYNIEEVDGTEQRRDVIQRIIHEDYDPMTIDNDVCIVQVLEEKSNFINAPNYLDGCVIQKRFGFETVFNTFPG